ncbi:ergot alkaloid biosynthesis protein [Paenibacillus sp. CMAA1739]|uniref:ergot alkaloid biosynthesis protein n=1 Tax=Paenibacillus ottowii TaxID=2315729 RepID=UPI0027308E51|nr:MULTISPECIES: ergot alkaloid biosynthesis protein [Paenibacillus]MDP1512084.1 ergot alkaloid biosynthesis protein [Paenibacillus ottowii]MEC4569056.1 ergot alkaloid biosynthesis protein [Paenibacillus sp. CMAA1739]
MINQQKILITGGTGKTGIRIAERLNQQGYSYIITMRNKEAITTPQNQVYFNWYDSSTFLPALYNIERVYLVAPVGDPEPIKVMKPFIEKALEQGVRRFVLLSSASIPEEGPVFGPVHQLLKKLVPEWTVLRPSYFMQNFTEGQHAVTISQQNLIFSAAGQGKVGFVAAEDIAEVALRALIDKDAHNTEHMITGPDSLSYDDVSRIISEVTGRKVIHKSISDDELTHSWLAAGISKDYAEIMTRLDRKIREEGAENLRTDTVMRVTGKAPVSFQQFAQKHADIWMQESISTITF